MVVAPQQRADEMSGLGRPAIEGESPVVIGWLNVVLRHPSRPGHEKSRLNLRGPSRKAKYCLATDSERVP